MIFGLELPACRRRSGAARCRHGDPRPVPLAPDCAPARRPRTQSPPHFLWGEQRGAERVPRHPCTAQCEASAPAAAPGTRLGDTACKACFAGAAGAAPPPRRAACSCTWCGWSREPPGAARSTAIAGGCCCAFVWAGVRPCRRRWRRGSRGPKRPPQSAAPRWRARLALALGHLRRTQARAAWRGWCALVDARRRRQEACSKAAAP